MYPRSIRDYQIRVNSLNIPSSTVLKVDGMSGPATRKQVAMVMEYMDLNNKVEMFDESGITRVHWHWTASSYKVNWNVVKHYNAVFDKDGNEHDGGAPAQQQALYQPSKVGVSHTFRANTGAIGLSVAAMKGATSKGRTVDQGKHPMTWAGIDAMLERTMEFCDAFDIIPSEWTTITHAEVETNIGIKQRGKWDIRCFPDNPMALYSPKFAGDFLRQRMKDKFS